MPYEIRKSKTYAYPFEPVYKAAYACVKELGGKVLKHEPENKELHAQMDKRLQGRMLGDRSKLEMKFEASGSGETTLSVYGYPLNAVGQKLMFGARPGVVDTVITVFIEEVQKKLEASAN